GEPGGGIDRMYYEVKSGQNNNTLWFRTNPVSATDNFTTNGNIQIHTQARGALVDNTPASFTSTTRPPSVSDQNPSTPVFGAYPNPSQSAFTLIVAGSNNEKIIVKITDQAGRVIETRNNVVANQAIGLGNGYKPGIYIAEIRQGNTVKQLKLVKL
ncbi:MAG TPA: T9SS type A sorting domain-containing protein, partial [Ferruginibacter sp.]|nr:T9SS type A sorting domain-containing protein [Ferruginibacter sp.]